MKRRIISLILSGTLICSAVPAQAETPFFKKIFGGAVSWALNNVRSEVENTVNEKDEEITNELNGMGTFGRLLMCATLFCGLEFAMERLTKEGVGILDILLSGINMLGFTTPFSEKEQRGREFLQRHGVLGDPTSVDSAVQNVKNGYQSFNNGVNSFVDALGNVTGDQAAQGNQQTTATPSTQGQQQQQQPTTEQKKPGVFTRLWNALFG